jgi:hypothetical protein
VSEWRISGHELLRLNTFIQRTENVQVHNLLTRTAQESKLFPIMPYMMLSFVDAYYRYPDLLRKAGEFVTPEHCGIRAREVTTQLTKLTSFVALQFYLNGRDILIRMGLLGPTDNLEDLWFVADWFERFLLSYHQNSRHLWTEDAWNIAQELPERTLQVFEADAFAVDDRLLSAVGRFMATATQYSFLVGCESRVGLQASGPYRIGNDLLMHTRDFINLGEGDLPWMDGIASGVQYNNLTAVLITRDVSVEINDWGTVVIDPAEYRGSIVGVGLYTSDFLCDRYIPVGMGSRTELAETLEGLTELLMSTTRALYEKFSGMTLRAMTDAGTSAYFRCAVDFSHIAGTYHEEAWSSIDERAERFREIMTEEYALDAYVDDMVGMSGYAGGASDYYLNPVSYASWRRAGSARGPLPRNGRRSFTVPAHVLVDHDYSLRVDLPASSPTISRTIPRKETKYLTTHGRVSVEALNEMARSFKSPVLEAPWSGCDDEWVKWNWKDRTVDELYRWTQEGSRLLRGSGSSLRRDDIAVIRRLAGEPAWTDLEPPT